MVHVLLLGFLALAQVYPSYQCIPDCCGKYPCCGCGLPDDVIELIKPEVGTKVDGKEVVTYKRFITDDLFGSLDHCLDCCGQHPCCSDCGLGDLFGHHGHTLFPPMTTEEPKSPEKEETYGTDFNSQLGHIIDTGFTHIDPPQGHVDPLGGLIDSLGPAKPYYETLGKKK